MAKYAWHTPSLPKPRRRADPTKRKPEFVTKRNALLRARRDFLQRSALAAGWLCFGCSDSDTHDSAECRSPFSTGELVGELPFIDEGTSPLETPVGVGLDGRLYTDLTRLDPDSLVIANERFYIRTLYPDLLDPPADWPIAVIGQVDAPSTLALADLRALVEPLGVYLLECSGNASGGHFGLISAADWAGVRFADILPRLAARPEATRVRISGFDEHSTPSSGGHSTPGASWIFTFDELLDAGAFLALEMNGTPLPKDHGAPVRLFVPGWYGCTCIKWVNEIALVDDDEPATGQMKEFAARTHQNGVPDLARDYAPAAIQQAAMPVRVEKWKVSGKLRYRIVGILWGGSKPTDKLEISFGDDAWEPVSVCPAVTSNQTWSLWEHAWEPRKTGPTSITLRVNDATVPQIRLDQRWYLRQVAVDEV